MKLLYVTNIDLNAKNHKGVRNKILGQINAFNDSNIKPIIICRSANKYIAFDSENNIEVLQTLSNIRFVAVLQRLYFFRSIIPSVIKYNPDILYIRYPLSSRDLFEFLKKIKARVVVEIPTYPYDQEFKNGIRNKIALIKDKIWRNRVSSKVNRYITIGESAPFINGVKTISISNGFYWDYKIPEPKKEVEKPYQIVFIGNPMAHHGFDKILEISSSSPDVTVNIIGSSKYLNDELKNKSHNNIKLHDFMEEPQLSEFLTKMDFGISTLSPQVNNHSPLKSRIYALHGIPFIYAGADKDFMKIDFAYQINAFEDFKKINFDKVFYELSKINRQDVQKYALTHLTWNKKMQPIIDYVKS